MLEEEDSFHTQNHTVASFGLFSFVLLYQLFHLLQLQHLDAGLAVVTGSTVEVRTDRRVLPKSHPPLTLQGPHGSHPYGRRGRAVRVHARYDLQPIVGEKKKEREGERERCRERSSGRRAT
ncbi:hypothetical protein INR49_024890 [Caranx melampygus]|nr:hypothetical protein INR49_024890 [Caranx melampygus]